MKIFRGILILMFVGIMIFNVTVIGKYGVNIFGVFFKPIAEFTWQGQFNFDFLCYLILSAIWIAWRNRFSSVGNILALAAIVLGISFFAPYIFVLSIREKGDIKKIFIGENE